MIWWLRAHRAGPLAAIITVLGVASWLAASGRILAGSVASPVQPGSAVPLSLWSPLGVVAALCWSCSVDDDHSARSVAVRSNRRLLAGFAAAATVLAIVALIPAAIADPAITAAVARNIAGLVGLALVVRPTLGAAGASASAAAYLAIAALLGAKPSGGAAWWAWSVARHLDAGGALTAATLFAAGLAATSGGLAASGRSGRSDPRARSQHRAAAPSGRFPG